MAVKNTPSNRQNAPGGTNQIPSPGSPSYTKAPARKKPPGYSTLAAISSADASRCRHVNCTGIAKYVNANAACTSDNSVP